MELLLKRGRLGDVIEGTDEKLHQRAAQGDDLTIYEESSIFTCHIMFTNYVVSANRVSGLSLPHLAFGDLRDAGRFQREPIDIIYYIYDSQCKNLLCRDVLDQDRTVTELFANNPHYASLTWYSTRKYMDIGRPDPDDVKTLGDQFKIHLMITNDFSIIMKPDIVYFPVADSQFLVKSSTMILPTAFATDPERYVLSGRPIIANDSFSLAYLNIDATGLLTIVYQERFTLRESLDCALIRSLSVSYPTPRFQGHQFRLFDSPAAINRMHCDYTILTPPELRYVEGA